MNQIGRPSKPVRIKPRSQQNGRPRPVDREKFNANWDKIFGSKKSAN